jgi:hypothetical protein
MTYWQDLNECLPISDPVLIDLSALEATDEWVKYIRCGGRVRSSSSHSSCSDSSSCSSSSGSSSSSSYALDAYPHVL